MEKYYLTYFLFYDIIEKIVGVMEAGQLMPFCDHGGERDERKSNSQKEQD